VSSSSPPAPGRQQHADAQACGQRPGGVGRQTGERSLVAPAVDQRREQGLARPRPRAAGRRRGAAEARERLGGQLVDVGERGGRERHHRLGRQSPLAHVPPDVAPADLRTDAVAGQQRVDRQPRVGGQPRQPDLLLGRVVVGPFEQRDEAGVGESHPLGHERRVEPGDRLRLLLTQPRLRLGDERRQVGAQRRAQLSQSFVMKPSRDFVFHRP